MEKYEYITTNITTSLKGKCEVKSFRDREGKKRYICRNIHYFDESEKPQLILAVGFKGCSFHIQTKDGQIKCFDQNNNYLGSKTELENILKEKKYA